MNIEDYIQEALELVSAWELEEPEFSQAVNDQAHLMAGTNPDLLSTPPTYLTPLSF